MSQERLLGHPQQTGTASGTRTRMTATRTRQTRHCLIAAWWRCWEFNPDYPGANRMCSRYHYTPISGEDERIRTATPFADNEVLYVELRPPQIWSRRLDSNQHRRSFGLRASAVGLRRDGSPP